MGLGRIPRESGNSLRLRLRCGIAFLLSHSVGQSELCDWPGFTRLQMQSLPLRTGVAGLYCRQHRCKEGRIMAIFIVLPYGASESHEKRRAWSEDSHPCLSPNSTVPCPHSDCQAPALPASISVSSAGCELVLPLPDCPRSDPPSTLRCHTSHPSARLSGCPCFAQKLSVPQITHSTSLDSSLWHLHIHHLASISPARLSLLALFQPDRSIYHFSRGHRLLLMPSLLGNPSHSAGPTRIFSSQYGLPRLFLPSGICPTLNHCRAKPCVLWFPLFTLASLLPPLLCQCSL